MKLYQVEWCGYCQRVRSALSGLGLACTIIDVPDNKIDRKELFDISGQYCVPTLITDEGSVIADDDEAIIEYLKTKADS